MNWIMVQKAFFKNWRSMVEIFEAIKMIWNQEAIVIINLY